MDSSELMFGGRSSAAAAAAAAATAAGGGAVRQSAEAEAWRRTSKAMQDKLHALSSGQVGLLVAHPYFVCDFW